MQPWQHSVQPVFPVCISGEIVRAAYFSGVISCILRGLYFVSNKFVLQPLHSCAQAVCAANPSWVRSSVAGSTGSENRSLARPPLLLHSLLEFICPLPSSISRPGGTPGWLWNLLPGRTEHDHHNVNERLGPVQPLYLLSRPRPAPATGRRDKDCTDPPANQRLRVQLARAAHELARCTRTPADSPACTTRTRRRQALH